MLLLAYPAEAMQKIPLATGTYEPFVITDGGYRGSFVDIISAAFDKVGMEVELRQYPWPRCEMLVQEGEVFGAFPFGNSQKRSGYAWFADKIWQDRSVFFYLAQRLGDYDYTSFNTMHEYVIGGTAGNMYLDDFKKAGLKMDIAPQEISGLHKLLRGRIDLFAEEETVGWAMIAKHFSPQMTQFRSTPTPWRRLPLSIIVSQKYPNAKHIMEQFNEGLRLIRESGEYDEIIRRYHINANQE